MPGGKLTTVLSSACQALGIDVLLRAIRAVLLLPLRALNINPFQFFQFLTALAFLGVVAIEAYRVFEAVRAPSEKFAMPDWLANTAWAEGAAPPVCIDGQIGVSTELGRGVTCPENYYAVGNSDKGKSITIETPFDAEPGQVRVSVVCCPLPERDMLEDSSKDQWVEGSCPAGYIATGGSDPYCFNDCKFRCSMLRADRYYLSEAEPGIYWRKRFSGAASGRGTARQMDFDNLPLAIRFATSMTRIYSNPGDGCVGYPFGSVLVGKRITGCGGYLYAQIYSQDTGKPVPMFADCRAVAGLFSGNPKCHFNPEELR